MDINIVDYALKAFVLAARQRLEEAAGIGRAAQACADAGQIRKAVEIVNDVDHPLWDAQKLLELGAMIARLASTTEPPAARSARAGVHTHADASTEPPMDRSLVEATLKAFVGQASDRLDRAVGIARAAEVLSEIGRPADAVSFFLDVEPLLYEAKHFINTASIINRMPEA